MKNKIIKSNQIFPWFNALSGDLMFWIAIDTIFLTIVKELNVSEIVFLTTGSTVICIVLHVPLLKLIKKVGNTYSIRFGTFLLLCGAIMLTFCDSYIGLMIGMIFYATAYIFKNMEMVLLKNNLKYLDLNDEHKYMEIMGKSNTIYSTITAVIAFSVGFLFNINHYLPMYGCIIFCIITFIMSFYIYDVTDYEKNIQNIENKTNKKLNPTYFVLLLFIVYALFCGIVVNGHINIKLLIQYNLMDFYKISLVASTLGIIIFITRVGRVFVNLIFNKIYKKLKNKSIYILFIPFVLGFSLIVSGYFLNINIIPKTIMMTLGFTTIMAIWDPGRIYIQDLLLKNISYSNSQKIFNYFNMVRNIGILLISALASVMLIKLPIISVVCVFAAFSIVVLIIMLNIYKMTNKK